uniref:Venom peptide n=1 Tax=Globodera pallida TaxID=36090 RepID=A0A183CQ49_GLOPA
MKHFPKEWLPILLLIAMIAYSVSVEVIEDGTPEEEDLAKALALSKRFFWRTMMEKWDCYK